MKEIYMIWEEDWGSIGVFFADKKAADEFASLRKDCSVKTMKLYESIKDYKSLLENKGNYINLLERKVKNIANELDDFVKGYHKIDIVIKNNKETEYYEMSSNEINTVLEDKEIPSSVLYRDKISYDGITVSNTSKLKKYLPEFTRACLDAIEWYDKNKKLLEKYKKEISLYKSEINRQEKEQNENTL